MPDNMNINQTGDGSNEAPAGDADAQATDEVAATLESDLRKLQDERNNLFEQLARVQADFRNAQKRLEGEKMNAIQFANSKLITSLLPVIDNFERALEVDSSKADVATVFTIS